MKINRRQFLKIANCISARVACGGSVWSLAFNPSLPSRRDLDLFIASKMATYHIPGLSLAIIENRHIERRASYGWANLGRRVEMRPHTLLNIGSVTKTITATALMQLYEQGHCLLDDEINKYLPFAVKHPLYPAQSITFRQLLTHTSSVQDGPAYGESYSCGDPTIPLGKWLREYLTPAGSLYSGADNFGGWAPGAKWKYSNVGFGLLGHLVEILSAMPFHVYCKRHMFEPLAMTDTAFYLSDVRLDHHAIPYTFVTDGDIAGVRVRDTTWVPPANRSLDVEVPHCLYSFPTISDGLARTSAESLSRFLLAYANQGTLGRHRVLKKTTVAEMFSVQCNANSPNPNEVLYQGLGWRCRTPKEQSGRVTGQTVWYHTGADPGISTLIQLRPADGRGLVVMVNGDGASGSLREIADYVFDMR